MKMVPAHGISDAASISAEFSARQDHTVGPGESKSTLEMGEVAVVAGTSIGDRLSTQAIFVPRNGEGGVEFGAMLLGTAAPFTRDFVLLGMVPHVMDTTRMRRELLTTLTYPTIREGMSTM